MTGHLSRALLAGILVAAASTPAVAVTTQPRTVTEWSGVSGPLLPGPGGGVVSTDYVLSADLNDHLAAVAAYRLNGARRWLNLKLPSCGNCDGGQFPKLRPDGRYGPIGPTGDDYWAVDRSGKRVTGCLGVVTGDGACIFTGRSGTSFADSTPATIRRDADGTVAWTTPETGFDWFPEFDVWPEVVADEQGVVYAAFGDTYAASTRRDQTRVVAYDPTTGAVRWRLTTPAEVVGGLDRGVLINRDGGVVALDADGSERWSLPPGMGPAVETVLDTARDRLVLRMRPGGATRVRIVRLSDGSVEWTSPDGFSGSAISLGASGTVYVALGRRGLSHVRAVDTAGAARWLAGSAGTQVGILERPGGQLLISSETGIITRLDLSRVARLPRRGAFGLSPRRIRRGCYSTSCEVRPGVGAILRMNLPSTSRFQYRIVQKGTRPGRFGTAMPVPAGRSAIRIPAGTTQPVGPAILQVRWTERGRAWIKNFPIVIRK